MSAAVIVAITTMVVAVVSTLRHTRETTNAAVIAMSFPFATACNDSVA
jgi:tellurite resistance protein TehA-like permease